MNKTLFPMSIVAGLVLAFTYHALEPLPEVWVGDRTNRCIAVIQPDGTEQSCPTSMTELPERANYVYVFEDVE